MTDNQNNSSNQKDPSTPEGFVSAEKYLALQARYSVAMFYIGQLVAMIERATGLTLVKDDKPNA